MNNKRSRLKAIYKAELYEYEDGRIDISYVCDVNKNKECNKKFCSSEFCTHTLEKRYAKNYYSNNKLY